VDVCRESGLAEIRSSVYRRSPGRIGRASLAVGLVDASFPFGVSSMLYDDAAKMVEYISHTLGNAAKDAAVLSMRLQLIHSRRI